jgi:hypothetical protein
MEMPEDCFECPFGIIDDTEDGVWCNALAQQSSGQREDCPIICSLPEGHGRLGDLDALGRKINEARIRVMQNGQDTNPYWECGDIIAQAKTIVPAERSET